MRKKGKNIVKIVIASVLIFVIISLLATTIVLSLIKRDYNISLKAPTTIRIYNNETNRFNDFTYEKDSAEYKAIITLLNDSYNTSLLSLLVTKNLDKEIYIENKNSQTNVKTNVIEKNPDYFYIEFVYTGLNTLMLNDEPYYKTDTKEVVTYTKLLLEIKPEGKFGEVTTYVENYNKYSSTETISSSYQIISYANQSTIYSYINGIIND